MISMEKINQNWSSIIPSKGQNIARRADADHPLDFFIGYNEEENMQMMLLSDEEMQLPDSSQQVQVRSNQRTDGKYAVCFILMNPSLRETFVSLCWDIMLSTFSAEDKKKGNEAAVNRFGIWLIMLAKGNNGGLSESNAKGLLGELLVLQRICIPLYGKSEAVNGWIGPLHADRDFEYVNMWYEAKAVSPGSEHISISSFDQFDIDNAGKLVVCRVDKASPSDPNRISLNSIIKELSESIGEDSNTMSTFHIRLMLSGLKADDQRADEGYLFKGFEVFDVKDDFPRIRRSSLPAAIDNGEYRLELSAITAWREM